MLGDGVGEYLSWALGHYRLITDEVGQSEKIKNTPRIKWKCLKKERHSSNYRKQRKDPPVAMYSKKKNKAIYQFSKSLIV